MFKSMQLIRPSADFCFGRDTVCLNIINGAFQRKILLLFGGRQSGKTTILLNIQKILLSKQISLSEYQSLDIPIYFNLMDLPYDATPNDFWSSMSMLALAKFNDYAPQFRFSTKKSKKESGVDLFVRSIQEMLDYGLNAKIRFLFLIDEAKRILGHRFPRGVQDNIFSILYGEDNALRDSVGMIFTGAQDLYKFGEDDTSPIASRAAFEIIKLLDIDSVKNIVNTLGEVTHESSIANMIYAFSGGHPGLSVRLGQVVLFEKPLPDVLPTALKDKFMTENIFLLRTWADSLSPEAKCLQNILARNEKLNLHNAILILKENNLDTFKSDRAIEELMFTGLVDYKNKVITSKNRVYWEYIADFILTSQDDDKSEIEVWQMIKQAELSLRNVIQIKYTKRWTTQWQTKVIKSLSPDEQKKLERTKEDVAKQYPLSPKPSELKLLDYLYLGQLLNLILFNEAWDMFMHMFRDRRFLEDMRRAISPVRNDIAHFRTVPDKELNRCRITCDDLLVILEKELLL